MSLNLEVQVLDRLVRGDDEPEGKGVGREAGKSSFTGDFSLRAGFFPRRVVPHGLLRWWHETQAIHMPNPRVFSQKWPVDAIFFAPGVPSTQHFLPPMQHFVPPIVLEVHSQVLFVPSIVLWVASMVLWVPSNDLKLPFLRILTSKNARNAA